MNSRKFISGVSAFAIAASAFVSFAVTASAATTYTEDFSAVTDAGAWWDTVNGDLTATVTDDGVMQLVNNSTRGNRAAAKTITFDKVGEATLDMDVVPNRGDRATTLTFTDGSGNGIFTLARTATTENYSLVVTDAAGEATTFDVTYIEKYHVNASIDYTTGEVTVKLTDIYNNKNVKQSDCEVKVNTNAVPGTINFNVEVRRGGTVTFDNISLVGVVAEPTATASEATDVKTWDVSDEWTRTATAAHVQVAYENMSADNIITLTYDGNGKKMTVDTGFSGSGTIDIAAVIAEVVNENPSFTAGVE